MTTKSTGLLTTFWLLSALCLLLFLSCQSVVVVSSEQQPLPDGGKGEPPTKTESTPPDTTAQPEKQPEKGADATPDTAKPDSTGQMGRRIVLVEHDQQRTPGSYTFSLIDPADGKRKDFTPLAALQKSDAIFVSFRNQVSASAGWPSRRVVQFDWEAPDNVVLVASRPSGKSGIRLELYDLTGKVTYLSNFADSMVQFKLSPDGQDIWSEDKDGRVSRSRRHGFAVSPQEQTIMRVIYADDGRQFLYTWRKADFTWHYTLMSDDGIQARIAPHTDPNTQKPIQCTTMQLLADRFLCTGSSTTRHHFWRVSLQGLWKPFEKDHAKLPERNEQHIGTISKDAFVYLQRPDPKGSTTIAYRYDIGTQAIKQVHKWSTSAFTASATATKDGLFWAEQEQSATPKRMVYFKPNDGQPALIDKNFDNLEEGYQIVLYRENIGNRWGLLTSQWIMGRAPSQPGLLRLYNTQGKTVYQHDTWGAYSVRSSVDGSLLLFINAGSGNPNPGKPKLIWLNLPSAKTDSVEMRSHSGLISITPR